MMRAVLARLVIVHLDFIVFFQFSLIFSKILRKNFYDIFYLGFEEFDQLLFFDQRLSSVINLRDELSYFLREFSQFFNVASDEFNERLCVHFHFWRKKTRHFYSHYIVLQSEQFCHVV